MKIMVLTTLLTATLGCGGAYTGDVKVHGEIRHTFDVGDLEKYFILECSEKRPDERCYSAVTEDCAKCLVGHFLSSVTGS